MQTLQLIPFEWNACVEKLRSGLLLFIKHRIFFLQRYIPDSDHILRLICKNKVYWFLIVGCLGPNFCQIMINDPFVLWRG